MRRSKTVAAAFCLLIAVFGLAMGACDSEGTECEPDTCVGLGYECGIWEDGCGAELNCGDCFGGETCNTNTGQCGGECTPSTCVGLGYECGIWGDGCGNDLDCGDCSGRGTCQDGVCVPAATEFFVSPTGSGDDCTLDLPCSLVSARDAVRASNSDMSTEFYVHLRGGIYALSETFELGPQDSGGKGHDVVYQAFAGETPVLSGGLRITGWGLHDAGENIYRAPVPASMETRQLYVNGVRAQRARGALNPSGFAETATGYTAPDASMSAWGNQSDIEVVALVHWKTFRCSVASISGSAIIMDQPCWDLTQWHQGYDMGLPTWIENAYELLDIPGEWYLDRSDGFIYYIPRAGEDLATAEVIVPVLETLLSVTGTLDDPAHDIRFEGITFRHATWLRPNRPEGYPCVQGGQMLTNDPTPYSTTKTPGNVALHKVNDIRIERCRFEHLGASALVIEYGSRDNVVEGCVFEDISGGAIQLGDVDQGNPVDDRAVTRNNVIRNNYITECGQEYFDGVGIFVGYTDGTIIEHNELRNLSYTGISVGWGWSTAATVAGNNRVMNNLGAYVMQRLSDGGQIYTLSSQPNSEISGNYFHNQVHVFGSIYLDQGSQYYSVTNNVIASAPYWYILQPQVAPRAQNNVVRSNFSDSSDAYCCGGLGCCTEVNDVGDNIVFAPGSFPVEAKRVIGLAGIQAAYEDIRDTTIRVEAEDYNQGGSGVGYLDLNPGNQGGTFRGDDVDVYFSPACSNDHTVGYTQTGEWLAYYIDARPGGVYDFEFKVGTQDSDCAIELWVDEVSVGSLSLPKTGAWNSYEAATMTGVLLGAGAHRIRLVFSGGFNLDRFEYTLRSSTCDPSGNLSPSDVLHGDFDGDGVADILSIYQDRLCWEVTSGVGGSSVWLTGWGRGGVNHVGDFDGDGLDDLVIIFLDTGDQQWHWHLALSTGRSFAGRPNAHVGYGYGNGSCVRDYDGDGVDEVIVLWTPSNICADLNVDSGEFVMNSQCAFGCD